MRTKTNKSLAMDVASGWVHRSVADTESKTRKHAIFIAVHLAFGLAGLLVLPMWLAIFRNVTAIEVATFIWLASPIFSAVLVSHTGKLELGIRSSLILFSGFTVFLSMISGSLHSAILIWLIIVPIEAAMSGSRKTTIIGIGAALLGFAVLWIGSAFLPLVYNGEASSVYLSTGLFSVFGILIYSGLLALRLDRHNSAKTAAIASDSGKVFRLLANNSTDLITLHEPNGDIRFASQTPCELLGNLPEKLSGKGLFDRVHLHDRIKFLQSFSEAVETGCEAVVTFRVHLPGSNADNAPITRWLEMRCCKLVGVSSGQVEIAAITRDVSAKMEKAADIDRQSVVVTKTDVSKTRFLAGMSHELRTPLNAIIGFSDILKQDLFGRMEYDKHAEYARLINQSGKRLLNLVNDIIDGSKIDSGQYSVLSEPFNVCELVAQVCAISTRQATEKDVSIHKIIPADIPELCADPRACKRILANIISNAVKFSKQGGVVEVGVKSTKDGFSFIVSDKGIGMSPEELALIGQPFSQTGNLHAGSFEGSGFGLYIVSKLTKLQNGQLNIESSPGNGTRVTILFPVKAIRSRPVPANENPTVICLDALSKNPTQQPFRSSKNAIAQAKTS